MTLIKMRFTLAVLAGLATFPTLLVLPAVPAAHAEGQKPLRGVVEMFTSQGCSSCPPADKVLASYAGEDDILALSWHVDYWNYLGWEDTFSSAEFTKRQHLYAKAFKRRGVYTPQAVINGRTHAVGSHHGEIEANLLAQAASPEGAPAALHIKRDGRSITIASDALKPGDAATLWIIYYDPARKVDVKRGENRGKTIRYHNVVRETAMLGMVKNAPFSVELPLSALREKGYGACAVILQSSDENGLGPIVAAARIGPLNGF